MDKDRIKGKMEDIGGGIQRQAGEWTGDEKTQVEGAAHQVKGKLRNAVGQVKDAARDVAHDAEKKINRKDKTVREREDAA
jgi:uncharacterized protein YjbJ (UPF0337 family)